MESLKIRIKLRHADAPISVQWRVQSLGIQIDPLQQLTLQLIQSGLSPEVAASAASAQKPQQQSYLGAQI